MSRPRNDSHTPAGQYALHQKLEMRRPLPAVRSLVGAGARRTKELSGTTEEYYPLQYLPAETLIGHLTFALKNEPLDLGIIHEAMAGIGRRALELWVRSKPTSGFSRRAWFLYETLTGQTLDLEEARAGIYVDALDTRRHYSADPQTSARHRVRDNLLGGGGFCPVLRRTPRLEALCKARLDLEVARLTQQYAPETLARAVSFLYTKETRSSFAIEGERPSRLREERFWQTLHGAADFHPSKEELIRLQAGIVDPRYAAHDWRDVQNFVSQTAHDFQEQIHFICPRPQDVPILMQGWMAMMERVSSSDLDAVLAAAVSAFAFVFVHPFEDGNGRIHRFLIHAMLARRGFSPPGVILPVSAAILRQRHLYDQALEVFSRPLLPHIDWEWTEDRSIEVLNTTDQLYCYFDATAQAEYLYERVADTIQQDFKKELDFLSLYDACFEVVRDVVDMPDRRASLLVRLCLQNQGHLAKGKRDQFAELTDEEVAGIEAAIRKRMHSLTEEAEE